MPEIFPQANTSAGWVDALDPLFDTIAGGVATKMQSDFGPAEFVEADGWFALETGPWLYSNERSSFKDGQESFIPSVGHLAGAAARTSSDSLKELQQRQIDQNFLELMRFAGKLQQQEQDQEQEQQKEGEERELIAPCTVSKPEFIVPTEEEVRNRQTQKLSRFLLVQFFLTSKLKSKKKIKTDCGTAIGIYWHLLTSRG